MRIAILGFGREGKAVFKYLKNNKAYKNAGIFILDKNPFSEIRLPKITIITGSDYLKNLADFNIAFRSPGIPYNLPEIQKAIKKGVKISSATQLFFENCKNHIIGITGTKGKGTTSTLLYQIFRAGKRPVVLAGNIGRPALEILPNLKPGTTVILELSSFQLQDLKNSPQIAAVLEIFPDHLDSHKNFKEYLEAKSSIARHQKKSDRLFYTAGNRFTERIAKLSPGQIQAISGNGWKLFSPADLKIQGSHNFQNAVMASTIALAHGIPKTAIIKTIKNFRGLPHRLEFVKEIKKVKFYNDSAGTNPQTATAAIHAFQEPLILIAGGKDKGLDYAPFARAAKSSKNLACVILFGENKNKIATALRSSGKQISITNDLKSAVSLAYREALKITLPKANEAISYKLEAIIVFSPASASFDMFHDYAERGEEFKKIVNSL